MNADVRRSIEVAAAEKFQKILEDRQSRPVIPEADRSEMYRLEQLMKRDDQRYQLEIDSLDVRQSLEQLQLSNAEVQAMLFGNGAAMRECCAKLQQQQHA